MVNVDMKALLTKLNGFCTTALHNAAGLCVSRTNYEILVEHFLLKCLETPQSDLPLILRRFEIDPSRVLQALTDSLEDAKTGNAGKPVFSPILIELFEDAWLVSSVDMGEARMRSGAVLLAFLAKPSFYGTGRYVDLFKAINRETLQREFWAIVKGSSEQSAPIAEGKPGEGGPAGGPQGEGSFLQRFCVDFTARAREGKIDPVFGRDEETRQIVDVLARRRKNNPILVGEPGVGKTAAIEGLALRIAEADVPDMLQGVSLLGLDMGALEAGAGMKGEFENRLKGVINEIKASEKPIILFIDEAHTLVGAGGQAGGSDAANLLKPALARGELRTCAATTWSEYKKYFEKDPALARRFQLISLKEPDVSTSVLILQGLKEKFEQSHKVIVRNDAVEAAAEYADRYIMGRFLPDKAIDLLDTSCARIKINLTGKPPVLEDTERAIQAKERVKRALERDRDNDIDIDEDKYNDVLQSIEDLNAKAETIKASWNEQKDAAQKVIDLRQQIIAITQGDPIPQVEVTGGEGETPAEDDAPAEGDAPAAAAAPAEEAAPAPAPEASVDELKAQLKEADAAFQQLCEEDPLIRIEVSPDVVAQVVSDWTGVPLGKLQRDESQTVLHLADRLRERIKGQNQALDAMAKVIKAAKSGIKNPNQPIGVFLLVGPSGVGKTETGLSLADLLFGGERHIVTINMSEFKESHTVSRLIGSPPGYVGYGEGGMLTEAVRQQPYSVVLLDEVEKAHINVMELFYQVFDKGVLTDGEGKEINFKNTILILTSNLATDVIQEMTAQEAEGEEMPFDAVLGAVRPLLSEHFKPALLARMNVIPYRSLNPAAMKNIVKLKLSKLQTMLLENNKMQLTYGDKVVDTIADRCTEVETGARNIDYILNGNVLPQLSQTILEHMTEGGMPSKVYLDVDKDGEFTMDFGHDD